ncbi:BRISC and BRCA1-A complex member 1-like isoform X2 [Tubulanus polymorphus]
MESLLFKSRAGDKFSPMKLIKRALGIYLQTKSQINRNHEYALIALHGDAVWVKDFTKDPKEVVNFLDDLSPKSFQCDSFDIGSLFEVISNHVVLPVVNDPTAVPPPFTARAILFYGRSHCVPSILNDEGFKLLNSSPYFFIDAFYVHEPASDDNKCEEVFNFLCDLDTKERSYIFEVAKNLTRVYDHIAQLLAHPLQRPYQKDLYFKINSLRDG